MDEKKLLEAINKKFDSQAQMINIGFQSVTDQVQRGTERVDSIDEKFNEVGREFKEIELRYKNIDRQLRGIRVEMVTQRDLDQRLQDQTDKFIETLSKQSTGDGERFERFEKLLMQIDKRTNEDITLAFKQIEKLEKARA